MDAFHISLAEAKEALEVSNHSFKELIGHGTKYNSEEVLLASVSS
jgi:hypothetical protein